MKEGDIEALEASTDVIKKEKVKKKSPRNRNTSQNYLIVVSEGKGVDSGENQQLSSTMEDSYLFLSTNSRVLNDVNSKFNDLAPPEFPYTGRRLLNKLAKTPEGNQRIKEVYRVILDGDDKRKRTKGKSQRSTKPKSDENKENICGDGKSKKKEKDGIQGNKILEAQRVHKRRSSIKATSRDRTKENAPKGKDNSQVQLKTVKFDMDKGGKDDKAALNAKDSVKVEKDRRIASHVKRKSIRAEKSPAPSNCARAKKISKTVSQVGKSPAAVEKDNNMACVEKRSVRAGKSSKIVSRVTKDPVRVANGSKSPPQVEKDSAKLGKDDKKTKPPCVRKRRDSVKRKSLNQTELNSAKDKSSSTKDNDCRFVEAKGKRDGKMASHAKQISAKTEKVSSLNPGKDSSTKTSQRIHKSRKSIKSKSTEQCEIHFVEESSSKATKDRTIAPRRTKSPKEPRKRKKAPLKDKGQQLPKVEEELEQRVRLPVTVKRSVSEDFVPIFRLRPVKSNPVALYLHYLSLWKCYHFPGEKKKTSWAQQQRKVDPRC